jgi:hypothetical protein
LGGLGNKDGLPVAYTWVLPGIAPLLLPWLAVLALLTLKPNRRAAAWLIWLPLGCVMGLTLSPMDVLPSNAQPLLDIIPALAIGLAAVWLLSNYLKRRRRFVTLLCILLALAGFSALSFLSAQGADFGAETVLGGILLGVGALISVIAFTLAGLICRSRYRPVGIYLWLLVLLPGLWLVISLPFFLIAAVSSGGRFPWSEFVVPVLSVALGNFALFLPFLILASASPFFRDRLKSLLHVKPETPPMIAPVPATNLPA